MTIDPRTIRSHTFATEGPTAPVMRTAELAAQATGQPQAVHSHPHGTACWPAEDPNGVCLVVIPTAPPAGRTAERGLWDLTVEPLVPARPDVSAPTLHAPVLTPSAGQMPVPVVTSDDVPVVDPTTWRTAEGQQALRDQYPDAPIVSGVMAVDPDDLPHVYGLAHDDPTNWPAAGDAVDPGGYSPDPPSRHPDLPEDPEGNAAAGQFPSAGVNGGPGPVVNGSGPHNYGRDAGL